LQTVGNGVSLFPWRKITGVCWSGPAAPKPITGVPSEPSGITGKPAGNDVPTDADAFAPAASASTIAAARKSLRFTSASLEN
jgi:hypothetical protein